jgi:hypothetical protein
MGPHIHAQSEIWTHGHMVQAVEDSTRWRRRGHSELDPRWYLLQSSNTITTKVNDTLKGNTKTSAEKIGWKYPTKQINNNSNVPKGTKNKVYNAVVSPNSKCCLMMAHVWPKHVAVTSNVVFPTPQRPDQLPIQLEQWSYISTPPYVFVA